MTNAGHAETRSRGRALQADDPARAAGDDPILTSKLVVPAVPGWIVPRPRIEQRIAAGVDGPLTVVAGPPGAGKTMAIASWLDHDHPPGPVAWITLDEYDNHPRIFWSYVTEALRRAGTAISGGSASQAWRGADHAPLLRLASELAAHNPPVVLILDDLHLLTEPRPLEGLAYLLRHARPGLRLVAASRIDPQLPLHQYRLSGELAEVRADDLAFSVPEAALLMAQHGITLRAGSLESLTKRTEGWGAGLRLAAISMDGRPDPDEFVRNLAADESAVVAYLTAEVLNTQPAKVRNFLLSTSILESVSADIAAELTEEDDAERTVCELARANAFVQTLGGGWYRYHTLLAEVMRLKLRHQCPGRVRDLHQRAAGWYRRHGRLNEGVRHAAEAGDWQLAADMVIDELNVGQLIEPWGDKRLTARFQHLPHDRSWTRPQPLLVEAAMALCGGQDDLCAAALGIGEGILEQLPAGQETQSRLAAALIRLGAARHAGDLGAAAAAIDRVEALFGQLPAELLAAHPELRAQVISARGAVGFWSGHLDDAARSLAAGIAAASAADLEYERAQCLGHLALVEAVRGRLGRAAELAARGPLRPAGNEAWPVGEQPSAAADVALAWVHLERGELADVRGRLKGADAGLQARPDKLLDVTARLVAARCSLADGHAGIATDLLGSARDACRLPPWLEHSLTLAESQACALAGDIRAAVDAAERADPASAPDAIVALAKASVVAGDRQVARNALERVLAESGELSDRLRLDARLVDAQLCYDSGDPVRGHRSLESAFRLGQPEHVRLPFVMERAWIRPVLRTDPDLARSYRRLFDPASASHASVPAPRHGAEADFTPPEPAIVEPLSEREREVLGHVAGMLSTAEIANQMYISVNTVKTHLKSIHRKLAAAHRGEAVRRARELRLL